MCGIAGIIGDFNKDQGEKNIDKMLKVIEHRGPDSSGYWSTSGFAFGMRRLSIIDISGGDQPIWASGVGIIFNGEIYNFKKLRNQLETEGVSFSSHSDTEVILQMYLQKGIKSIQELEGMFGICLYDPRIETIYLVRDRLGVKPLYYSQTSGQFAFASEIKSILEILNKKAEINTQSLWDYLSLRYVPAPSTIWSEVKKLEPGHYIEYDLKSNKLNVHKYWELSFNSQKQSKRNYEKEFETLFLEAVEKRLLASDVPVGILLSGGLDSSCVAAAAVELGHKNFHTFSVGFRDGGEFSELKYAEMVAKHIGAQYHQIIIGQNEFMSFLNDYVWYADEPIADLASIPLYFVSKLASKYVKVVLSGEGSDEILAGYNMEDLAKKLFYLKKLNVLPNFFLKMLPFNSVKTLARSGYKNFLAQEPFHMTKVFTEEEKKQFCILKDKEPSSLYIKNLYALSKSVEPLDQLQEVYCRSWLVEDLLMKADKMSMATSLEVRVPFLDHKLVEWAETLPLEWKIGSNKEGFVSKKILRRFAEKRISKEIIDRPKKGFPVPAYMWLQKEKALLDWGKEQILTSPFADLFIREEINNLFSRTDLPNLAHQQWNLIILALWSKRWLK